MTRIENIEDYYTTTGKVMKPDQRWMIEQVKAMQTALRVIRTWASVDGALVPRHVRDLCDRTLER